MPLDFIQAERLPRFLLSTFALTGPADVVYLSLRYRVAIAQKFHGMSEVPHHVGENFRFRNAVDLPLLRELVTGEVLPSVRVACQNTFRIRAEQPWSRVIALPRSWREPFAAMSCAIGCEETEPEAAQRGLRAFLDTI